MQIGNSEFRPTSLTKFTHFEKLLKVKSIYSEHFVSSQLNYKLYSRCKSMRNSSEMVFTENS